MTIHHFQKYFGIWNPAFKAGYLDFVWDIAPRYKHKEYLKGYEYGRQEREECTALMKDENRGKVKRKKRKSEMLERVLEEAAKGYNYIEVSRRVGCDKSYAYKIMTNYDNRRKERILRRDDTIN